MANRHIAPFFTCYEDSSECYPLLFCFDADHTAVGTVHLGASHSFIGSYLKVVILTALKGRFCCLSCVCFVCVNLLLLCLAFGQGLQKFMYILSIWSFSEKISIICSILYAVSSTLSTFCPASVYACSIFLLA